MQLKTNERIDDLQYNQLKIIQNSDFFRFGSDAVELANFVSGGSKDRAVDLGSGSGIISILLALPVLLPVGLVFGVLIALRGTTLFNPYKGKNYRRNRPINHPITNRNFCVIRKE